MRRTTWRAIVLWAVVGAAGGAGICLANLSATESVLGGLVAAVPGTPLDEQQRAEGLTSVPAAGGHDGSQFYAIAHDPLHPGAIAGRLDKPRYRLQRILFPTVAWAVHPSGAGSGLVWTMFGVLVAGMLLGGVSTGALASMLGGPPWPAAAFSLMLGSILALRITTPDALSLALAMTAIALSLRRRPVLATVVAVAAVLTREPTLLVLAAFAFWRRDRDGVILTAVPAAVAGGWWIWLLTMFPGRENVGAFVFPMSGWRDSVVFWMENVEGPLGLMSAVAGLILGGLALVKTRPSHPLWWPIAANCFVLVFYSASVLAPERNASRVFLPIQILALVALTTRSADRRSSMRTGHQQRHHQDFTARAPAAGG